MQSHAHIMCYMSLHHAMLSLYLLLYELASSSQMLAFRD